MCDLRFIGILTSVGLTFDRGGRTIVRLYVATFVFTRTGASAELDAIAPKSSRWAFRCGGIDHHRSDPWQFWLKNFIRITSFSPCNTLAMIPWQWFLILLWSVSVRMFRGISIDSDDADDDNDDTDVLGNVIGGGGLAGIAENEVAEIPAPPALAAMPRRARGKAQAKLEARKRKATTELALRRAVAVADPTTANRISSDVFGFYGLPHGETQRKQMSRLVCDTSVVMAIDQKRQSQRMINKGLVSYATRVFDDATMWCRRPHTAKDTAFTALRTKLWKKEKLAENNSTKSGGPKAIGRNASITVANTIQHAFAMKRGSRIWRGAQIHGPADPVPAANWSTLLNRKRKWSLCTGGRCGDKLVYNSEHQHDIQAQLDSIRHISKVICTDQASNNTCVIAKDGREMRAARTDARFRSLLDIPCQSHNVCLLTRPVYEAMPFDMSTICTRLSHFLQGAKSMTSLLESAEEGVEDIFDYKEVLELLAEAGEWREYAMLALESSISSGDMTAEEAESVVQHDNGPWWLPAHVHYCLGCCVDRAEALEKAKQRARLLFHRGMPLVLLYRWKAMDRGFSFTTRTRCNPRLLDRGLRQMWKQKTLEEAAEAAGKGFLS